MKAVILSIALLFALQAGAMPNERVLKSFNASFANAESIQWFDGENEYNVYFVMEGIKCRVWYDEEGVVKKCIRYYEGSSLPPMVLGSLLKKYPDLKIFGVTEYSTPEEFVFQVTLEDDKKWYVVHADATGHCTMVSKLNKGESDK